MKFIYLSAIISLSCLHYVDAEPKQKKNETKKKTTVKKKKVPAISKRTEAWTPEKQLASFKVPEGFVVELVASEENGLINPIDLAFDDAGRLWTQTAQMYPLDPNPNLVGMEALGANEQIKGDKDGATNLIKAFYQLKKRGKDKILVISDPTKQVEGQIPVFADGMTIPQSILPYKNGVFVAHGSEMLYLEDNDNDGKYDKHKTVLTGFGINDTHTLAHTLVRGPGGWVHFSQGALNKGLVKAVKSGESVTMDYSKVGKFSLDGQHIEIVNNGLNNIWGFHLKTDGQWYGTEANDWGFSVTPMHPMMGYKGIGNQKIREYQPFPPKFHDFVVGGTGISGLAFDENGKKGFPEKWRNKALLANPITSTINTVVADRNPDGSVVSKHLENFLSCEDDWFRPVNIEFGPDGCLYIVDWYNKVVSHNEVRRDDPSRDKAHGRIWRVRHESQTPAAIPDITKVANKELLEHLTSDIVWEKRAAWHQIADRNATELAPQLRLIAADQSNTLATRVVALWSLESLGKFDQALILTLLESDDADLRREAVRSLESFNLNIGKITAMLKPLEGDPHHMVKEQILRTLAVINKANPVSIEMLVSACLPDVKETTFGNGYERKFQRFLARKALEQYPNQLASYLNSDAAKKQSKENIAWASQALAQDNKIKQFVKTWKSSDQLDADTLISVTDIIDAPSVFRALKNAINTSKFVKLAIENQSMLDSKKIRKVMDPILKKLINSNSDNEISLALSAVKSFGSDAISKDIIALVKKNNSTSFTNNAIDALALNATSYSDFFISLADDEKLDEAIRLKAISALALASYEQALTKITSLLSGKSEAEIISKVYTLASTHQGCLMLLDLVEKKIIPVSAFDYNLGNRVAAAKDTSTSKEILKAVQLMKINSDKAGDEKIEAYLHAAKTLKGDPVVGKGVFQSCVMCHQVGDKGFDIAPSLDGSSNREIEALLTAIVKPDDAVEGGYRLYRLVKIDGSIIEGYMYKSDVRGTTIAYMGGSKVFTPKHLIKSEDFVPEGRSFMPPSFGNYPEQTMVDILSYIKTIK